MSCIHERIFGPCAATDCVPNAKELSRSGCYKTVLFLETPFWVAGAAESVKIGRIGIGASNKSVASYFLLCLCMTPDQCL